MLRKYGIFVILFALGVAFFMRPLTPEKVFAKHEEAVRNGDFEAAYSLTTDAFQQQTPFFTYQQAIQGDYDYSDVEMVKENGRWKIHRIHIQPRVSIEAEEFYSHQLKKVIRSQLMALRNSDVINSYYGYTTKHFQKETPLNVFQEFVQDNPLLLEFDDYTIKFVDVNPSKVQANVSVETEKGNYLLDYGFKQEGRDWKVDHLVAILPPEEAARARKSHPDYLKKSVKQLLTNLSTDIPKAYSMTSASFRQETSLDEFEAFVFQNPALTNPKEVTLKVEKATNGIGVVHVEPLARFDLSYEDHQWKVDGIEMNEMLALNSDVSSVDEPIISKILVGTAVDDEGMIDEPKKKFPADTNVIYFNVPMERGRANTLVTLFLTHISTGSQAPPLSTRVEKNGNLTLSFSYAAPKKGWPPGEYVVKVTTTDGGEEVTTFKILEGGDKDTK